jgi:hypothetical protein
MAQIKTRPIAAKARGGAAKAIALDSNRIDAPPPATAASARLETPLRRGRLAAAPAKGETSPAPLTYGQASVFQSHSVIYSEHPQLTRIIGGL